MPKISEHDLQRAFCIWLRGHNTAPPALRPDALVWHTANGGSRRDAFEGKRLKEIGLLPGVHDLLFLRSGLLFGLEWKAPGGRLSPAQVETHKRMLACGMVRSAVVDSLLEAKETVFQWGLTTRSC